MAWRRAAAAILGASALLVAPIVVEPAAAQAGSEASGDVLGALDGALAAPGGARARVADAVAGLPTRRPSGRPLGPVAVLGVRGRGDWQWYVQQWLLPRVPDEARIADAFVEAAWMRFAVVDRAFPESLDALAGAVTSGQATPTDIADLNQGLDVNGTVSARVAGSFSLHGAIRVEARLTGGRTPAGVFENDAEITLPAGLADLGRWNPKALAVWLGVGLLVALRSLRGRGHINVRVDRRGNADPNITYTAYAATRTIRDDPTGRHILANKPLTGDAVTLAALPARALTIAVRRVERDPKTLQIANNQLEEKSVDVLKGRTANVAFEFKSDLTIVEISLHHADASPLEGQALLAVAGQAESTRYVRDGKTKIHLGAGAHRLLIGVHDRGFELPVRIEDRVRNLEIDFDIDATDKAFFTGARDAVAPYVHGDVQAAADALAAAGQDKPAALLRAELHRARGESQEAAEALEQAGRLKDAARLRAATGDNAGTAALLERAGDFKGAAEQHRNAGNLEAAVEAFSNSKQWDEALQCAMQSGNRSLVATVLERRGDRLEAARIHLEEDDSERAIAMLQGINLSDPRFGEASLLLAQLFHQRGEPDLALRKLDEAVDVFGSETSLELRDQIAQQFEARGDFRVALECYEHIRKRDIQFPGMAEKIQQLREKLESPAVAPKATAATEAGRQGSRYVIEEEIGRGGMGVVYRARDKVLGRVVALKRLPDNLKEHPTAVKLFLREARSAAAMNHPNVVTLYDAGQESGAYYITMEFMEGRPLNELLRARTKFPPRDALRLAVQVADGLAYAHGEGIVHRDIKPSNLFLTTKGRVKIMDFGLAKMVEEVRKASSIIAGTPYYMAPEQALGAAVDQRADLYAFGVSLYEFVVGDVPFREGDVGYHHRHTEPPDPCERVPGLAPEFGCLILHLMAKAPDDRPAHAAQVREGLQALLRSVRAD